MLKQLKNWYNRGKHKIGGWVMADNKDLLNVLWSGADVLRGKMDANEYKTYFNKACKK